MDKELLDLLVDLKIEAKAYNTLVDTILDNCRLSYSGDGLRIEEEDPIFSVIKAFNPDEYKNRLNELKIDEEARKEELRRRKAKANEEED